MLETPLPDGSKTRRVYLLLKDEIARGLHAEGAILPGELTLAATYGVSRVTIRRALEALSADGLLDKQAGRGSVVRASSVQGGPMAADMASLMPQLVEMVRRTEARLLSFSYAEPTQPVAAALGTPAGEKVQTSVRVRSVDGQPFSHLTTHVPETIARNYSEADMATTPLFQLLEKSGVSVDAAQQTITATLATPEVAEILGVPAGSALLGLTRVVRDVAGRGVEYLSALYRPDLYRLDMSLSLVGGQGNRHWEPVIGPVSSGKEAAE